MAPWVLWRGARRPLEEVLHDVGALGVLGLQAGNCRPARWGDQEEGDGDGDGDGGGDGTGMGTEMEFRMETGMGGR